MTLQALSFVISAQSLYKKPVFNAAQTCTFWGDIFGKCCTSNTVMNLHDAELHYNNLVNNGQMGWCVKCGSWHAIICTCSPVTKLTCTK